MGDQISSTDGRFTVIIQNDGNLVLYGPQGPLWASNTVQPDPVPPQPPVGPVPARVEGFGVSYYTALTDPDCDPQEWANRTRDVGSRHTRVWCFDAWANGRLETVAPGGIPGSMYAGFQPWHLRVDGRFDLFQFSEAYFDRVSAFLDAFHRTGQHVCLSLLELYTWTARKAGLVWVPTRDLQPLRNNLQGVRWGDPDDDTWLVDRLPDVVLDAFLVHLLPRCDPARVTLEVGNELPEKGLHARVRDLCRQHGWTGRIQVNRNEDTPSQYDNMAIGSAYDSLAIHGRETIAYLDEDFGPDQHAYRTFRAAYDSGTIKPSRFVLSSDGCGNNDAPPYFDEDALVAVADDARARGFAYEHQAREIKLGRFKLGRLDLNDLNVGLCRRLAGI